MEKKFWQELRIFPTFGVSPASNRRAQARWDPDETGSPPIP